MNDRSLSIFFLDFLLLESMVKVKLTNGALYTLSEGLIEEILTRIEGHGPHSILQSISNEGDNIDIEENMILVAIQTMV